MNIRRANTEDAYGIQSLINHYADKGDMLPRSLNEIYENIRDFWVCGEGDEGITGCAALHVMWNDLAEVKSLAVKEEFRNRGIGRSLLEKCIKDAETLGIKKVFVLTYLPKYFVKAGFETISREKLPHKIWGECIKCHKFPGCSETALLYKIKAKEPD